MLQHHLRKHSPEQPFLCHILGCQFKTKYKSSLLHHVRVVHSNARPFECPTDGCNYTGKTIKLVRSHLKIHSNEKPFTCQVPGCNYTCKKKQYLSAHTSRAHSDEKPFKCSICDFREKNASNLRTHERTHMKIKRFQCQAPNCSFSTHEKRQLSAHLERKHRKKELRCTEPGCIYRCSGITSLKMHLKTHELPMLKCPSTSCNFSSKFEHNLLGHIARFHKDIQCGTLKGERKSALETGGTSRAMETLHCSFPNCGYQTKFPHHYDRHRKTHNEEEKRNYVCALCFSRFSNLYVLKVHVQSHVGERLLSCSHCQYATVYSSGLVKHDRKTHHILVIPCGKEDQVRKCRTCGRNCFSYRESVLHSLSHLQPVVVLERLLVKFV